MQNIRKRTKKISLWKILGIVYNITTMAIWLWFFVSWANVIATNLPNTPETIASWNLFGVLFDIFA